MVIFGIEIHGVLLYLFIFCAKLIEVASSTMRQALIAKGNKVAAMLLGSVEITIWIIVTSTVLLGLREDPLRAVAFAGAFIVGIYLGIFIEDKLALGLSEIECIAVSDEAMQIADRLRSLGYGVTNVECEGKDGKKHMLRIKVLRKDIPKTMNILHEYDHLFVTVMDIRKLSRGSISRRTIGG